MTGSSPLCYRKIDKFEANEVPDGYIIYDEKLGEFPFLNLSAAVVFELCDGQNDIQTITTMFQAAFDLPDSPQAEIETCLASLVSQGLIEPCSQSTSAA